jgi:hypothetical protein
MKPNELKKLARECNLKGFVSLLTAYADQPMKGFLDLPRGTGLKYIIRGAADCGYYYKEDKMSLIAAFQAKQGVFAEQQTAPDVVQQLRDTVDDLTGKLAEEVERREALERRLEGQKPPSAEITAGIRNVRARAGAPQS